MLRSVRLMGLCFGFMTALLGCNQGDERLIEKATIEGKAQAEAELKAQLENMNSIVARAREEGRAMAEESLSTQHAHLAKRSSEMEADLASRQRFYQAVKGNYEGVLTTDQGAFRIRIILVPSLPPYESNRIRALEEVAFDLNNLYFNAQIIQWNPSNRLSAVGCRVENIRPDLVQGELNIASESCPNFYSFRIAAGGTEDAQGKDASVKLAQEIILGNREQAPLLVGEMRPTTNSSIYSFRVGKSVR